MFLQYGEVALIDYASKHLFAFRRDAAAGSIQKTEPRIQNTPPVVPVSTSQCNAGSVIETAGKCEGSVSAGGKIAPRKLKLCVIGKPMIVQILVGQCFDVVFFLHQPL